LTCVSDFAGKKGLFFAQAFYGFFRGFSLAGQNVARADAAFINGGIGAGCQVT